ncbi:MAG: MFS transporter [Calditrichaeota bacterium]|nr:MAG: MFS transporter [Calditrichota bacterium]
MEAQTAVGLKRLPAWSKIGYGIGNVAYSLPYQTVATFLVFYATAILKIPASLSGVVVAISAVWDALTDPVMGYLSDNTESNRLGRRHPYLLFGALAIALLSYLLWSIDPQADLLAKFAFLLILVLAVKTALTVYVAPYNALGGELSTDYDERSSIQGYRAFFYISGMIIAIAGSTMIFFRSTPEFDRGQLNPAAYPKMALTFSLIALGTGLLSFFATRRYIPALPQRSSAMRQHGMSPGSLYRDLLGALKNHDFLMIALMIFVIEVGFQLGIAIGIHVNTYTYHLSGPMIGMLAMVILGTSILSQPLWVGMAKKYDKKSALLVAMIIGLVGFLGAPWTHVWWRIFPIDAQTLPYTLALFSFVAGIGNGAFMSLPYSMVADTADAEELATGKRDEGVFFGMYTLAYKLGTSFSLLASGFVLNIIGFDPGLQEQSAATQFNLAMVPTYFLLIVSPLALYFLSKYRIDRHKFQEIQQGLAQRRRSSL